MANQRGETTSIGHFYNRCVDAVNNLFDTMSFWTHSKDVEFVDGKTAETKVGAINGITSDLSGEADDIAASIKCVNELNASLTNLGGFTPIIDETTGEITGYKTKIGGADTVFPFKSGNFPCIVVTTHNGGVNTVAMFVYFNEEGIPSGFTISANSDTSYSQINLFNANILAFSRGANSGYTNVTALQDLYYMYITNAAGMDNNGTIIEKTKMNKGDKISISVSPYRNSVLVFTLS